MKKLHTGNLQKQHFTIVEMMMVVAIFMIILATAAAAWLNADGNANLKRAARMVNSQLNLARSKAIAARTPCRLYFFWNGNTQYCGVFDESGNPLTDEPSIPMPGRTFVYPADHMRNPAFVEFDKKGQVSTQDNLTSSNGFSSFIVAQLVETTNGGEEQLDDSYFTIYINEFNGRTSVKYTEPSN